MEPKEFTLSWGALWRVLAISVLVAVLWVAKDILVAAVVAIIISSALDPIVSWLEERRVPRILGTLALYILAILAIALIVYIIVPIFLVELNQLLSGSNQLVDSLTGGLENAPKGIRDVTESIRSATATLLGGRITFLQIISRFLGGILITVVIFVLSFYMTIGRDGVEKFLTTILPYKVQKGTLVIYHRARVKITHWMGGQILLSAIVGLAVFIGLAVLQVKYALILGVVAAVLELVPYVGPIFSGTLAVLFAGAQDPSLGLYALILFVAVQQLESHVLIPSVIGYTTNLSPVVVILALLIGAKIFGLIGIILAVPVAVVFQEILKAWPSSRAPEQVG